jgi:hypothetical protein
MEQALSQLEVIQNMCLKTNINENGLMLYYRFDQQSGTTVTDLTGHGYRGTLTNMSDSDWITSGAPLVMSVFMITMDQVQMILQSACPIQMGIV